MTLVSGFRLKLVVDVDVDVDVVISRLDGSSPEAEVDEMTGIFDLQLKLNLRKNCFFR